MTDTSLDDIKLFVAVAQAGSLTAASELTGIPTSRLSRRLTELEHSLGTRLLDRGKKGVLLNEPGKHFFRHAQTMLHHAQTAIQSIRSIDRPKGLLRISAPTDITHRLLLPRLHDYLSRHPEVNIELNLSQQKINMIQDGIDIAIRAGAINNEHVVAKPLLLMSFGLFAHHDYLRQHGTPQTPNDLYLHKTIVQTLSLPWQLHKGHHHLKISPQSHIACNDFLPVEQMVKKGMGIGLLDKTTASNHPGLMEILCDWKLPKVPLSIVYYKNRGSIPTVRSFVSWLQNAISTGNIDSNHHQAT